MKKVLIVDDAPFMRGTLKIILERNGFSVIGEAEDGKTAVNMYHALKPDIVAMDVSMPVMDGITALKTLKRIDPDCRVFITSVKGQEPYISKAMAEGARGCLFKPFDEISVISVLKQK